MPYSSTINNPPQEMIYVGDQSPVLHGSMTEFMNRQKIAFREHIFNIEHLAEIIDNLDSIL
jgi:hypothetical protein